MRPNTYNPDCDFDPDQRDLDALLEERNKDGAKLEAVNIASPPAEPKCAECGHLITKHHNEWGHATCEECSKCCDPSCEYRPADKRAQAVCDVLEGK